MIQEIATRHQKVPDRRRDRWLRVVSASRTHSIQASLHRLLTASNKCNCGVLALSSVSTG